MKIIDYVILRGDVDNLNTRVKELIAVGWQPSGVLMTAHTSPFYLQVMVKYDDSTSLETEFSNRALRI